MRANRAALRWLRIAARAWSLAAIAFVLLFFVGEGLSGNGSLPTATEWLGLALFPLGVTAGLAVAWWREGMGGGLTVGRKYLNGSELCFCQTGPQPGVAALHQELIVLSAEAVGPRFRFGATM